MTSKALAVLLTLAACATAPVRPGPRPSEWAASVEQPALPNLHRVSPTLWRGAQPERQGYAELEQLGVHTVVSLRSNTHDRLPPDSTLELVEIPMRAWAPKDADVVQFLQVATDPARQPVFVHCQHGADRTGLMCAVYRVVVEGWSKETALEEMQGGGYGYHLVFAGLLEYLRELDVERIRTSAGLRL